MGYDVWYLVGIFVFLCFLLVGTIRKLVEEGKKPRPTRRLKTTTTDIIRVLLLGIPVYMFFGFAFYKQWFAESEDLSLWAVDFLLSGYFLYGLLLSFWSTWEKSRRAKDQKNWERIPTKEVRGV